MSKGVLVYGHAKTGKSELVAGISKSEKIKRIYWFDLENSAELLTKLPENLLSKFTIFKIPDSVFSPRGFETMIKVLGKPASLQICKHHGKVGCSICKTDIILFKLDDLTDSDLVVIDSGSQLANSTINYARLGESIEEKTSQDQYGEAFRFLTLMFQQIQYYSARTNMVVIAHVYEVEERNRKRELIATHIYPMVGTKPFSMGAGKFFGHVIYCEKEGKSHKFSSNSTSKEDTLIGSRLNFDITKNSIEELFK